MNNEEEKRKREGKHKGKKERKKKRCLVRTKSIDVFFFFLQSLSLRFFAKLGAIGYTFGKTLLFFLIELVLTRSKSRKAKRELFF